MERTAWRDFLTGLTALAGLAGLFAMLIIFGELKPLAERNYTFTIAMTNAGGLDDSSPVRLDGVKVGQVTRSSVAARPTPGAVVTVRVRKGVDIPRSAVVSIDRGLLGGSSLDFSTKTLAPEQFTDAIKQGERITAGDTGSLLGSIADAVKEPMQRLADTAANIDKLAAEYTELGKKLNDLVEPRSLKDVSEGKHPNLRTTMERMDKVLGGADSWLNDPTLRSRVESLFTKADTVIADAQQLTQTWTKTGQTVDTTVKDIGEEARALRATTTELAEQAKAAFQRIQTAGDGFASMIESVNKGEGTLGQLVTNPDLYRTLDDAATRLEQALEEAQLLIEKYKREGIKLNL
jgi:phospholipid/cholesterol/gamma-HCH transport system substrate-binding protein